MVRIMRYSDLQVTMPIPGPYGYYHSRADSLQPLVAPHAQMLHLNPLHKESSTVIKKDEVNCSPQELQWLDARPDTAL